MQKLTKKEEEIMTFFWEKEKLFVRELLEFYNVPKPHFNTLSTIVRGLEDKGFLGHNSYGNTYQYFATISKDEYHESALNSVINKYFHSSYLGIVSSLIAEEKISINELKKLIDTVEKSSNK